MRMLFREKLRFPAISLALATVTGLGLWNATASEHGGDAEIADASGDKRSPGPSVGQSSRPFGFRGDGTGVFPAEGLVSRFHEKLNVVWKIALPHWGPSSPVAWDDRVYVITDEGWPGDTPLLVCVSIAKGEMLWQAPIDNLDDPERWPAAKARAAKAWRKKHFELRRAYMTWWNKLYWDNATNTWKKGVTYSKRVGPGDLKAPPEQLALVEEAKREGWDFHPFQPIGVSGGYRGRKAFLAHADYPAELKKQSIGERGIWLQPNWSTEGPFFGSTMGSPIIDETGIYVFTGQSTAACFTKEGKCRWVRHIVHSSCRGPTDGIQHTSMASPVLAAGLLVVWNYGDAGLYSLDKATGKVVWRCETPRTDQPRDKRFWKSEKLPVGYEGHMGPGGTPVVLDLNGTAVVIAGHGLVARARDGKILGQISAKEEDGKPLYPGGYQSATGAGDVYYAPSFGGRVMAMRLRLDGENLTWEQLWITPAKKRAPGSCGQSLLVHDGRVYGGVIATGFYKNAAVVGAFDAKTGELVAKGDRGFPGNTHASCIADGKLIITANGFGVPAEMTAAAQNGKAKTGTQRAFAIFDVKTMKRLGEGLLAMDADPEGDIRGRHIAHMGMDEINWGPSGPTAYGNRIFIRSNDHLYCIGDPKTPYVPPEEVRP